VSFLKAVFLTGLASIAVPVVIHLIFSIVRKRVPFSTLMFIKRSKASSARRFRLRELLLLLLRVAAFALITIAFARPLLEESGGLLSLARVPKDIALVIDNSPSMGYHPLEKTFLTLALERAGELVEQKHPDDRAAVFTTADPRTPVIGFTGDVDRLKIALNRVGPSFLKADASASIKGASRLFRDEGRAKEIFCFSDMAENLLDAGGNPGAGAAAAITFVALMKKEEPNFALLGVSHRIISEEEKGANVEFSLKVANYSFDDKDLTVRLRRGGAEIARKVQRISRGIIGTVKMSALIHTRGRQKLVFALSPPDGLDYDNEFHYVLHLAAPAKVLMVEPVLYGREKKYLRKGYYLGEILGLRSERTQDSIVFETSAIAGAQLEREDLGGYSLVMLLALPEVRPAATARLARFVREGGGLFIVLGEGVDAAAYNAGLMKTLGLGSLGRVIRRERGVPIRTAALRDTFLQRFTGTETGFLYSPTFAKYYYLKPAGGTPILTMPDRSVLLTEHRLGEGRIFVFASTLWRSDFNDAVTRGEFMVPFVREAAKHLAGVRVVKHCNFQIGRNTALGAGPRGAETVRPGFSRTADGKVCALYVEPSESRLLPLSEERRAALGCRVRGAPRDGAADAHRKEDTEIWKYFILSALVVLLVESVLSNVSFRKEAPRTP